jgi:hypothetical protein
MCLPTLADGALEHTKEQTYGRHLENMAVIAVITATDR